MGSLISEEIREIWSQEYGMGLSKWIEAFNLFSRFKK
jgi:hypothetical protein